MIFHIAGGYLCVQYVSKFDFWGYLLVFITIQMTSNDCLLVDPHFSCFFFCLFVCFSFTGMTTQVTTKANEDMPV